MAVLSSLSATLVRFGRVAALTLGQVVGTNEMLLWQVRESLESRRL